MPTIIPEQAGSLPNNRSMTAHWIVLYYSPHMTQCLILIHATHSRLTQQCKVISMSVYTCWILIMWYFIDPCWKSLVFFLQTDKAAENWSILITWLAVDPHSGNLHLMTSDVFLSVTLICRWLSAWSRLQANKRRQKWWKLQHIHWKDVAFLIFKAEIINIFILTVDEMIVCDMKGVARRDQPTIYHVTLQFPSSLQALLVTFSSDFAVLTQSHHKTTISWYFLQELLETKKKLKD